MRHSLTCLLLLSLAGPAGADDGTDSQFKIEDAQRFGITRHQLNHATRVTGWQISQKWYFGQQGGAESGISLVWQRSDDDQMSISTHGIRFTRRF